jgi:hypothetical protein
VAPKRFTVWSAAIAEFIRNPRFFIIIGLFYITLSWACVATLSPGHEFLNNIEPVISFSLLSFSVFITGLLAYYIGTKTYKTAMRLGYIPIILAVIAATFGVHFILGQSYLVSVLTSLSSLVAAYIILFGKIRYEYLFTTGFFLFWLNFAVNGAPLLDISIHNDLFRMINSLFIMGFFFMIYSLVRMFPKYRILWALLIFSAVVSTYRIYISIAFLTWIFMELKQKGGGRWRNMRLPAILVSAAVIIGIFLLIGQSIMKERFGSWEADPTLTSQYRLAFTLGVFNDVVEKSLPFGYVFGESLKVESSELTCRVLYGCTERITSTAFGDAMLNFGIIGVILAGWWAGVVLAGLYRRDYGVYAILFASLISVVEVGINLFILVEFIYIGWLRVVAGGGKKHL